MTDALDLLCVLQLALVRGQSDRILHPNPTELATLVAPEQVEQHRNLSCDGYDECLDAACRGGWRSFTCARCEFFRSTRTLRKTRMVREAILRPLA